MLDTRTSVTVTREISATPERIFAAWTDPAKMMRWWGPEGANVHHAEADLRIGGGFSVTFDTPDGATHTSAGEYLDIVTDERLIFTWQWITSPEGRSLVSVLLTPSGPVTKVTVIHEKLEEDALEAHREGWRGALVRLASALEDDRIQGDIRCRPTGS